MRQELTIFATILLPLLQPAPLLAQTNFSASAANSAADAEALPSTPEQMEALRNRYETDPAFREMVQNLNILTGNPHRGVHDSLQAIDQDAIAGGPGFLTMMGMQPPARLHFTPMTDGGSSPWQ